MLWLLTIANDTTQLLQGFRNCAMQGHSRWYDCVNKIGSKTSDEESTSESYIFITHWDETNQYVQCKMCSIRTGLCKMGGKSTSQRTDQPTDLAINVLASRPTHLDLCV